MASLHSSLELNLLFLLYLETLASVKHTIVVCAVGRCLYEKAA